MKIISVLKVDKKLEVGIGKSNKNLSISFFNGLFDFKDQFDMYFDKPKENWTPGRSDNEEGVSKVVFNKVKYKSKIEDKNLNKLEQHFHKQNNQTNLLDFLTNESNFNQHKITVFADGKKWDFALSQSKQWTALIKEVKEQVQNIQNQVGNNFSMTLNVIKTPLGKYLLINPGYFNSQIIEKNPTNSIGQNGVFNQNEQQAFDKHKEAVLSGKAPVVKVLYNLDGQEILGSLELGKPLLYDNDELVLAQASSLTNVNRDLDHVFLHRRTNRARS